MGKQYFSLLILIAGLVSSSFCTLQASLINYPTNIASWKNCDVNSCEFGGSTNVTSNYAKTKYPILLAHGMGGFSAIGPLQYWNGITEDLVANGANVFVAQQASLNTSEIRGEQLLVQAKLVLAITGAQKINLIGHSHGSQSIRYVAGIIPNRIASVTAVGGPTMGTDIADAVIDFTESPTGTVLSPVMATAFNSLFSIVGITSGNYYEQDFLEGFKSITSEGAAKFNKKFPAGVPTTACGNGAELVNGIRYFSWSGTSVLTNVLDPFDYALVATSKIIDGESDGLIPRCSSHLGTVIRDNYGFNHLDEINQVLGLVGFLQNPVTPYRVQANRLKNKGL
ncbi:triacylglycerol lipase [Acinetobacter corruptisaponis]|uniref:Triacylglycerol lipase n=1 Tax=Acinetobacter corruptisaponis TaxID=3045147 RepID=A0ABY8S3V7_9GAMM|nr:triacylglycerol lipase [Acinetobacter sp. KCTC 92772]WHP06076.1 triacylglycerol lipase [Acinetobacter sp. KCTC 92772]